MKRKSVISLVFALVLLGGGILVFAAPAQQDGFEQFAGVWTKTDFSMSSVGPSEIISGGPPIDGIPPYYPEGYVYPDDAPQRLSGRTPPYTTRYTTIEETNSWLPDEQQVIVVIVGDEARAYPLILLNNHEIANTEIGGIPVAVTFCPLCNASIAYDRRVNGETLHFGVSGLLRNSDLIMWDHETQSWWQQFTGQGIVGAMTGVQLEIIPSLVTSYGEFKAQFPDGAVLDNQHSERILDSVSYAGYDQSGNTFLFRGERDERLFSTTRVLGYFNANCAVAYPFERLAEVGVVNDRIDGQAAVVFWQPGAVSLFTSSMETGSAALYHAELPDGTELTFSYDDGVITDDQTGSTWNIFGHATDGDLAGTQLEQYFAYPHFWFAWAAFRPDTLIWEAGFVLDVAWAGQR